MSNLAIIVGSTRPGRKCMDVAKLVFDQVQKENAEKKQFTSVEIIDLATVNLPFLDEPTPAVYGNYTKDHTKAWSETIKRFQSFIFVTPEFNRSIPGVLKNAIDFLAAEWKEKPAGIVCYGGGGGLSARAHLTQVLEGVKMKVAEQQVSFTLTDDFVSFQTFQPRKERVDCIKPMVDQLILKGKAEEKE